MRVKLYHPKTGEELLPLFCMKNGRAVYPVLGASPDDDSNKDHDDGASGDEDDDSGDGDGDDSGDTGDKDEDSAKPDPVDREKYESLKARMKAADRRAADFEKELRKLQSKDKSELEKAQQELSEAKKAQEEAAEALNATRLENAVLRDTQFQWYDPEDVVAQAMRALRKGDLEINEDGEVEDVADWLKQLAKRKPHFVRPGGKRKKNSDDDGDEDEGPTGGPVGSGRKKGSNKLDEAAVRRRLPALR